jgi:hypothetical protein
VGSLRACFRNFSGTFSPLRSLLPSHSLRLARGLYLLWLVSAVNMSVSEPTIRLFSGLLRKCLHQKFPSMGSTAYMAKASPRPRPRKIQRLLALASAEGSVLRSSTLARVTLASLVHDHQTVHAAVIRRSQLSSILNTTASSSGWRCARGQVVGLSR